MTRRREIFDIEVRGRRVRLGERTLVMGVLNVTPDSFSDGGLYLNPTRALEHAREMVRQGADWIDVGGESTRPGARSVPIDEELRRVLPAIRVLSRKLPSVPISIDTTKAEVAEQAVRAGASIINDISGLRFDPRVAEVARRYRTPLILMHLRGRPETMQQGPFPQFIWRSVRAGLARSVRLALAQGVRRRQLIIDPGLGFGKSRRQNFEILAYLGRLRRFHLPVLVGTSRKSFVQAMVRGEGLDGGFSRGRSKKPSPGNWPLTGKQGAAHPLVLGDAAAIAASILAGAHIVRVHNPGTALPAARIADAILKAGGGK